MFYATKKPLHQHICNKSITIQPFTNKQNTTITAHDHHHNDQNYYHCHEFPQKQIPSPNSTLIPSFHHIPLFLIRRFIHT